MKNQTLIIHNPRAGQKKKIQLKQALQSWKRDDCEFDYIETEYAGHATEITKKAIEDGYLCVAAAGGDGTVNEIASVLVNTNVALGIIPMGSGNGLARHNLIPLDLKEAFYNLFQGSQKQIDAGKINDKNFFCAAGIGFDALVSQKFATSQTRGLISYMLIALKEYLGYSSKVYQIKSQNKSISRKAFFITFANANQFGNHAYIAPQAKIDDGMLEVCILKPFFWLTGFSLAIRLFNKTIQKSSLYESFQSNDIYVTSDGDIPFHYDGEIIEKNGSNVTIKINPKALKIIVPTTN